ncbi:hypothetical protein HYT45_02800 [Candidatus Uhrbacteria bacterium]|nr:hypothetical protein [Candidatus Uhrbacteria bacterium]
MDITRVTPVEWLEGRVSGDCAKVIAANGAEYRIPFREQTDLKDGMLVKFTLCHSRYKGKQWVKRIMFLP